MKKCIILITGIVLLLCIVLFAVVLPIIYAPRAGLPQFAEIIDDSELKDKWRMAWKPEELESVSDIVVVFEPTEQNVIGGPKEPGNNYTVTTGIIREVLCGHISAEEEIRVFEDCSFNETTLRTFGIYRPMQPGEQYLLFLQKEQDDTSVYAGLHWIVDDAYGKYALDVRSGLFSRLYLDPCEELQLTDHGSAQAVNEYASWYQSIRELYAQVFE